MIEVQQYFENLGAVADSGGAEATATIATLVAGDNLFLYGLLVASTNTANLNVEVRLVTTPIWTFGMSGAISFFSQELTGLAGNRLKSVPGVGAINVNVINNDGAASGATKVTLLYSVGNPHTHSL